MKPEERKKRFEEIEKEVKENKVSIQQLHQWFKEEIDRKDKEIERLKKENHVLFKTALKSREAMIENKPRHKEVGS